MNKHKNMILKSIWFKKGELENLKDNIEGNYKEEVFKIIYEIYKRGDLE
jgi:hypothetical protein